jgi:hypothetical protein
MNEKQLLGIYKSASAAAGRQMDPAASASWKAVLERFPKDEVTAALEAWWNDTEPIQGSLLAKPRGATMPTPADLKARVLKARDQAYQASAAAQERRRQIEEFWRIADERGFTEQEIREKWPSYIDTRPATADREKVA